MGTIEEFVTLYNSINGATIKDKRKHLNEFLSSFHSHIHTEDDLNKFVDSLVPKTPLEEIFRIDVILNLERRDIILQELKRCNCILVRKLLRNWKLFGKIFSNITPNETVNDIFPHLSYSLKLQLLTGISKNVKNETLLDEYFHVLEEKYGLKIATFILPGCSIELIRSTVTKYHLKLTNSQLKRIFKKDKQFIAYYFEVVKKKYENIDFSYDYKNTLRYIAKTDTNLYWQICDKFNVTVKFGKHMTPTMIKSHKNIIEKGYTAFDTFHFLQMYKTMKKEGNLNEFLLRLYPETHYEFSTCLGGNFLQFIKKGSPSTQYNLISAIFTQKYNRSLMDYSSYFTKDLLEITPIKEREEILTLKVDEEDEFSYLYSTAVSVPKYKEQLQHSSDGGTRTQIGLRLYKTCAVNRDKDALLDVLKYLLNRYKNDGKLLSTFFEEVMDLPYILDLSEEHWQCLVNIDKILAHSRHHYYYSEISFNRKYILYLLKNNKSCHQVAKDRVKGIVDKKEFGFHYLREPRYEQIYWNEIAKCIDEYKNNENYQMLCNEFLRHVQMQTSSKKHPYIINNYRHMFDQMKYDVSGSAYVIQNCVPLDDPLIHDLFWKLEDADCKNKNLLWYAKHRPEILKENSNKILNRMDTFKAKLFLRELHKLLDADTIQEIKTCTLKNIQGEDYRKAIVSVPVISILAPETFLEIVPDFLPPADGKIDLEDSKDKIKFQEIIANSLANIKDQSQSLPIILKFCIADYLKFGLCSLYSTVYNSPERDNKNILSMFTNAAVSVRKHVLNLARHVLILTDFYKLISEWSTTEKNLSIRNIILKKIIRYLIANPSEQFWTLLKSNLKLIDANDREFHDYLMKFQQIPLNYQPKYIQTLYEQLSDNPDSEIRNKRFKLIDDIPTAIMDGLDTTFVKEVIRQTVCTAPVTKFHWKCVFFVTKEKQLVLFEENIFAFKKFLDENYVNLIENVQIRTIARNFLLEFYRLSLEIRQCGDLVQKFVSLWPSLFNQENFTKELILIHFTNSYFSSNFDAYETGLKVNSLLYDYINKYNNCIIHLFCLQLRSFLNTARIERDDLYNFMNGMFKHKKDENIYIATIYLLPEIVPAQDNIYENYIPVLNAIATCDIPIVRYHFDSYLTIDGGLQGSFKLGYQG